MSEPELLNHKRLNFAILSGLALHQFKEKCCSIHKCRIRPFHDSFIETDPIGCEAQLSRKVPPNENNFSWARFSLLQRLRPVKWARPAESLLSLPAHVFRICLKYSINSPVEVATLIFISSRTCLISEENVNRSRENILEVWNMVHLSRTSIGVGKELRSTSPGFPGVH